MFVLFADVVARAVTVEVGAERQHGRLAVRDLLPCERRNIVLIVERRRRKTLTAAALRDPMQERAPGHGAVSIFESIGRDGDVAGLRPDLRETMGEPRLRAGDEAELG